MRRANDLVASWMRDAGMAVREDNIGNLLGHFGGPEPAGISQRIPPVLLLGSHLDTVRDAGKFDGPLGVLAALACVEQLRATGARLPFAIEVAGFADEEGVRFQSTYLGSRVMAGTFNVEDLRRIDAQGVTMAEAIRAFGGQPEALAASRLDATNLLGYVEIHIEQGPVLEQQGLAVGVVTAIAGQTRASVNFKGQAGHAGTVPMALRRDALCAASEFILAVETVACATEGLVATVGEIAALPGASNVIPGRARLTLDVRHARDDKRQAALNGLEKQARAISERRRVALNWQTVQQSAAVACEPDLSGLLGQAVKRHQNTVASLPSGAGHDAAAMAAVTPVAMLFVRCQGGVSHHPDESVKLDDVRVALAVMGDFLRLLAEKVSGNHERL
jgi:allantoate deiminase